MAWKKKFPLSRPEGGVAPCESWSYRRVQFDLLKRLSETASSSKRRRCAEAAETLKAQRSSRSIDGYLQFCVILARKLREISGYARRPFSIRGRENVVLEASDIVGKVAPHFALPSADGPIVDLWSYKQRKNVVIYFFRSDIPACRRGLADFAASYIRYRALDAEVLGISTEDPRVLRAVSRELALTFKLLSDAGGRISKRYGVDLSREPATSAVFVLDRYNAVEKVYRLTEREIPDQEDILSTLEHVQAQCPE